MLHACTAVANNLVWTMASLGASSSEPAQCHGVDGLCSKYLINMQQLCDLFVQCWSAAHIGHQSDHQPAGHVHLAAPIVHQLCWHAHADSTSVRRVLMGMPYGRKFYQDSSVSRSGEHARESSQASSQASAQR